MLTIRHEQLDAFARAACRRFETEMVEYCRSGHARDFLRLGEDQVRKCIQLGIARAEGHGFRTERQICLYIDLMFLLGSYFDEDVQLAWAAAFLAGANAKNAGARIDRLHDRAMRFLDRAAGLENEYLIRALVRTRDFEAALDRSGPVDASEDGLLATLRRLYPEKVLVQGEAPTRETIRLAAQRAGRYGIAKAEGLTVYAGLMFFLGTGFDEDPQFPWAIEALGNPDSRARAGLLRREAAGFLASALG